MPDIVEWKMLFGIEIKDKGNKIVDDFFCPQESDEINVSFFELGRYQMISQQQKIQQAYQENSWG